MSNLFDQIASPGNAEESEPSESSFKPPELDSADETLSATPSDIKQAAQELLRYGYIEESRKPKLFRHAMVHEEKIATVLEPLDLALKLDTHRGVAFLTVARAATEISSEGEEWAHPLVRRHRLTLEQSLLIALLRQAFVLHEQEAGIGKTSAKISVEELLPQFLTYFEDSGSDAKNESRLSNLLDQLKTYGIVSEVDKNEEVTIRPLIAHLANPESLVALLRVLKQKAREANPAPEDT